MTERAKRDRPASNPGGMQCENCDEIFIGEEWHSYCAICQRWFDMGRDVVRVVGESAPGKPGDAEQSAIDGAKNS